MSDIENGIFHIECNSDEDIYYESPESEDSESSSSESYESESEFLELQGYEELEVLVQLSADFDKYKDEYLKYDISEPDLDCMKDAVKHVIIRICHDLDLLEHIYDETLGDGGLPNHITSVLKKHIDNFQCEDT